MNWLRSWWLRRHGVCPVHLTTLRFSSYANQWRGCVECEIDEERAGTARVARRVTAAEALAKQEREKMA